MKKVLLAALLAVALLAASCAKPSNPYSKLDPKLVADIQHMAALYKSLPQNSTYRLTPYNADQVLAEWETEVLPYYLDTGIVNHVVRPARFHWFFTADPSNSFHLLAETNCSLGFLGMGGSNKHPDVWVNGRVLNPVSPWYQDDWFLPTIIHEMFHDQGICNGDSPYVESSTQVGMLEVMAAMINSGNVKALPGFLSEWISIDEGALEAEALKAGPEAFDQAERLDISVDAHPALRAARLAASDRFWHRNGWDQLVGIVTRYELAPYRMVEWGLAHGRLTGNPIGVESKDGVYSPQYMLTPNGKDLVLDDLTYLFTHLDEIVTAAHPK